MSIELNATTGWYEMAFRGYDAALGRFMQIDPLASAYASYSGYHYAGNNPVVLNDPTRAYYDYYNGYGGCNCPDQSEMSNEEWMDWYRQQQSDGMAQKYADQQRAADAATQQWVQDIFNSVPNGTNAELKNKGDSFRRATLVLR